LNPLNGFAPIVGFSHDLHLTAFFDDPAKAGTDDTVVVCQKDFDHYRSPLTR
jgi:hypothetical protein